MDKLQEWGKTMAKVINFYIPSGFQKELKWIPAEERGEVIEIRAVAKMPDPNANSELALDERSWSL
jgi:hypothetical protein